MESRILEKIIGIAEIDSIGQLPDGEGTAAELAPSSQSARYLDGSSVDVMSVLILSKYRNQQTALNRLCSICNTLTRLKTIRSENLTAYGITVATQPNYITKEKDMWIYSCIINLSIYNKEEF